jgi:hypothetical protein
MLVFVWKNTLVSKLNSLVIWATPSLQPLPRQGGEALTSLPLDGGGTEGEGDACDRETVNI